jgi:uncharacterized protein YcbK (DUF882 family)
MGDLSPHFSSDELRCPDCGRCRVSGRLIAALEELRALGPEPITVLSGYRCPEHNSAVGGVGKSQHVLGAAADVRIGALSLQAQYDRAAQVLEFQTGGIGVYDTNFIHVDVREDGRPARWARVNGEYVGINQLVKARPTPAISRASSAPPAPPVSQSDSDKETDNT